MKLKYSQITLKNQPKLSQKRSLIRFKMDLFGQKIAQPEMTQG